jgi:hypothetical protein
MDVTALVQHAIDRRSGKPGFPHDLCYGDALHDRS